MNNDNTQLPAEVLEEINDKAEAFMNKYLNGQVNTRDMAIIEDTYVSCATEYANKLRQVEQENAELKRWKMEAAELLTPIHAYVHKNIEKSLGQCSVKLVLDRCKQFEKARTLLEKVISRHEAGLLPDRFIYDEIKTFLDGTK